MSTVQRSPLGLPTALAQGGLGCLEGLFTRDKAWEGRRPTRYQDIDEHANRSDVPTSKKEKCCTGTSIAAASLQLPWS